MPRARRLVRRAASAARNRASRPRALTPGDYDRVFFIVGEMRSGTSWLRRVLAAHPEIACGHEGSFFGRDYDREEIPVYDGPVSSLTRALSASSELRTWHALPWNRWTGAYEEDARALARLSIDYFLAKEVARTGKRVVGDKSPQHTACLREIHEIYPDASIVHIVRDGRDVAVSAMHHWWRLAQDREGGIFQLEPEELRLRDAFLEDRAAFLAAGRSIFIEERLRQLATRWTHRVESAHRDGPQLYGDRYIELRYEDLVGAPVPTLRRVLDALGTRSPDAVVERCLAAGSFERAAGRSRGDEDPASFFRRGTAGGWQGCLTELDRQRYKLIAGRTLDTFGYEAPPEQAGATA